MGFAVQMLTYGSATFGANSGDIAIFPDHFLGKIMNLENVMTSLDFGT